MRGDPAWQAHRLRCEGLAVARGGVPLLHGLELELGPGEALVLRGANGIGKTSLLRTIAGLQPPRAGRVAQPEDEVAYAAHADGLKSALTVAENLAFWAAVHGAGDPGAALAAMNLDALAHRRAVELSAGQKRRLGLARLAVTGRWLWCLDEPTVSLDAASSALFLRMVEEHLARGGAALIATHVDLGLTAARTLDLTPHRARLGDGPSAPGRGSFDEAFG